VQATGDALLASLLEELRSYPVPEGANDTHLEGEHMGVALPLRYRTLQGVELSFISTTTVLGSAVDVTVQELTLETFFPMDAATADHLWQLSAG
jgi:hypothetical protein